MCLRADPVPKSQEIMLKKQIKRLENIWVPEREHDSEWGAPSFNQPLKNGTVQFLSDFRNLNRQIKRKPYPIPKIQEMILNIEGFKYARSLDLNMGYYHIRLSTGASNFLQLYYRSVKLSTSRIT